MNDSIAWDTRDVLDPADVAAVGAGLEAHNLCAANFDEIRRSGCFARVGKTLIGGAVGRYWGTASELQELWVREDLRKSGIGSKLVAKFEERMRELGCTLLYLETFSFQAPGFYLKLGYEIACEFPGFPNACSKFVMKKPLL